MPKWALKSFRLSENIRFKRITESGLKITHYLVFRKSDKDKRYIKDFISNYEESFQMNELF
ncbi:hypothetical protein [Chryseobacterium populi]|uniref:hypothetical protein n=1 Tax=Chryseobacterium populi TaxID=1144316 RepID=UPI001EE64E03